MIKKKSLKKIATALVLSFVFFGCGISLLLPRAQSSADEQSDVQIHKNYDIESANGGKYANFLITEPAQYYSGGDINYNSGYMYEATAKGYSTSVRLLDDYSGTFSLIGHGFMENLYKSENNNLMTGSDGYAVDYQRLAFTFTNLENESQYIKLSFFQSNLNYLCLNMYYYDEDIGGTTALYRQDNILSIASSFTGKSFVPYTDKEGTNRPLRFSYDLTNQNFNTYAFRNNDGEAVAEHNLNALFQTTNNTSSHTPLPQNAQLPVFEHYAVDMTFDVKSQKTNTAKFIVYELCGQTLAGETPVNTVGASVFVKPTDKIVANFSYKVPVPCAYDILDGNLSSTATCEVLYNGVEPVTLTNGAFLPVKTTGFYRLIYTVKDSGEEVSTKSIDVEVLSSIPATEILFDGELLSCYPNGSTVQIPSAKAYSGIAYKKTLMPYYTLVQKDGAVLYRLDNDTDRSYTLDGLGLYDIVYVFVNELGTITTETKSIEAKDLPRFENTDMPSTLSVNQKYMLPVALLVHGDKTQVATVHVFAPDGTNIALQENTFIPTQIGEYTIRFSAELDGTTYQKECVVDCAIGAGSLVQNVAGIVSVEGNIDLPKYSSFGNGIRVLADARNSTFRFANPIDLNALDKDENLIELQVLSGDNYAGYTELIIELVDVENTQNTVKYKYRYNQWNDTYSYVLLNYNGKSLGIRNEAGHVGEVDNYFGLVTHNSFSGHKYKDKAPFAVRVDYAERQFFVREINNTFKMLLDADDPALVGENIWSGFSSGKVYVQVTMQTLYDVGGVIVTELAGQSLSGALLADDVAPNLYLENNYYIPNYAQMPTGCVGFSYKLPTVFGADVLSPYCDLERTLYFKKNDTELEAIEVGNANEFTPTQQGEYMLSYTVTDLYGNTEEIILNFSVVENRTVEIQFASTPEIAVVGEKYCVPEISVLGASGNARFEYVVYLNETEVRLSRNREMYLSDIGEIKIVYTLSDYLQENIKGELCIPIVASEMPIIQIDGRVPLSAVKGSVVVLPAFTAKLFAENSGAQVPAWIEVDGEKLTGNTFTVTKNKGEIITVQYFAGNEGALSEQTYTLTVLEPTYLSDYLALESVEGVSLTNEKFYTSIVTDRDNAISLPNVIVCDEMTLRFTIAPEHNAFERLQIKLFDSVKRERVISLTVLSVNETQSRVLLNGDEKKSVTVQGSFYSRAQEFYFIIDGKSKTISDVNGNILFTLDEFENGDYFEGFNGGVAYLTFYINGVETGKKGSLELIQVSNQIFASTYKSGVLQPYTDKTAPVLFLKENLYNHTVEHKAEIVIPAGWAYDVLKGAQATSLTLLAPNGEKIIENASCDMDTKITLTQYGYYTIRYTTDNNGKAYHIEYYVKVRNRNLPQISVDGTVKETYALNEKLIIPTATVSGVSAGNTTVYVFLQTPSARIINYTDKTEIAFTEKGEYQLIIYAVDEEYNVTEKIYTFKVV